MTPRKVILVPPALNAERPQSIAPPKIFKPSGRHARGARDKLQQAGLLLPVHTSDAHPKPSHNLVSGVIVLVDRVPLPIVNVELRQSPQQVLFHDQEMTL